MGDNGNVTITGFMGTGKTAVGRKVARLLGRPFVDMDAEIRKRAGKSIHDIFAEDGESTFRGMEATLCEELCVQQGLVIATGGGALVDPTNRQRMMLSGTVVCLNCSVDEIARRVSRNPHRPLLDVSDPRAEIERLLAKRHTAYATIPWQIEADGLSIEDVAARVIEIAGAITLPVRHPDGEYPVHIGYGLLSHIGGALRAVGAPTGTRIAVVSNSIVAPLCGVKVKEALRSAEFQPFACSMPDGEEYKTLATVESLYEQFLDGRLDRTGTVLALGGGVTGDVVGFAAATYMRGVRLVQVPTTLLAMVDASVGGKTGVDLPQGKNLVGAFHQPQLVVIDPSVLATLPDAEMRCGLAEVIKHGVIGDPDLFAEMELEAGEAELLSWWSQQGAYRIARALRVKIDVVEEDPYEQGRRAVLNLGHTVGHGLERLSDFNMRHGEAVSVGMAVAARIAAELDRAERSLVERIKAILTTWELPVRCPLLDAEAIWSAITHDKKKHGDALRWVLPRTIGEVEIVEDVPPSLVKSVLRSLGAR
jgi:shikimate kinase/3-dehydroquinate synthase